MSITSKKSTWLVLAVGSGAFAACNGVFAKLTTTSQTHDIAISVSYIFGFATKSIVIELLVRGLFFALNIVSNGLMWVLFTRALTASPSTTRVSILNVSSNFLVTALLGMLVFAEKLPVGWWLGACLLITGSVVIGRRDGHGRPESPDGSDHVTLVNGTLSTDEKRWPEELSSASVKRSQLSDEGIRNESDKTGLERKPHNYHENGPEWKKKV